MTTPLFTWLFVVIALCIIAAVHLYKNARMRHSHNLVEIERHDRRHPLHRNRFIMR